MPFRWDHRHDGVVFEMPFRDIQWTDQHTAQGFAWSPGGVSFGVPGDAGASRLDVFRATAFTLDPMCLWAVQVPFEIKSGEFMVGSVIDPERVHVERGRYELNFLARPGQGDVRFVFQHHFIEKQCADLCDPETWYGTADRSSSSS